jgi:BlaI family transcriptional regulator, penicillinase repressor
MEKLTRQEEKTMQALWKISKGFAKDVLDHFPDEEKPHYNTISSLIRSLEGKEYIGHKAYGNTYEYFPLISKEEYTSSFLSKFVDNYFENSYKEIVSFFASEEKLSVEDLKEIINMIEKGKK